jgi:hypothetical protein
MRQVELGSTRGKMSGRREEWGEQCEEGACASGQEAAMGHPCRVLIMKLCEHTKEDSIDTGHPYTLKKIVRKGKEKGEGRSNKAIRTCATCCGVRVSIC